MIRKRKFVSKDSTRQKKRRIDDDTNDLALIEQRYTNMLQSEANSMNNLNKDASLNVDLQDPESSVNLPSQENQESTESIPLNTTETRLQSNQNGIEVRKTKKSSSLIQSTKKSNFVSIDELKGLSENLSTERADTNFATRSNAAEIGNKKLSNAHVHIRSTAVFDFGGICKDFMKHGYCPFGDDCIYAHIREDYASGFEQDQQWDRMMHGNTTEDEKKNENTFSISKLQNLKLRKNHKQTLMIPLECPLCHKEYQDPVKTLCDHIFCKNCFLKYFKGGKRTSCPVCKKETSGILNTAKEIVQKASKKQKQTQDENSNDPQGKKHFDLGWQFSKSTVE